MMYPSVSEVTIVKKCRTPSGDENICRVPRVFFRIKLRNVEPRQGTKTRIRYHWECRKTLRNVEPRQGTKTSAKLLMILLSAPLRNVEPRQGTKTIRLWTLSTSATKLRNVEPRQGTKTFKARNQWIQPWLRNVEPRQGTKTQACNQKTLIHLR